MSGWLIQTDRGLFFFEFVNSETDLGQIGLPSLYDYLGKIPVIYTIFFVSDISEDFLNKVMVL